MARTNFAQLKKKTNWPHFGSIMTTYLDVFGGELPFQVSLEEREAERMVDQVLEPDVVARELHLEVGERLGHLGEEQLEVALRDGEEDALRDRRDGRRAFDLSEGKTGVDRRDRDGNLPNERDLAEVLAGAL